ncbi:MAG TPA: (Fe-S)-binding protein [Ruminiclostridium sp.]|nr:(Fe-S)-binding protein [Ruminiclostridium sp.]
MKKIAVLRDMEFSNSDVCIINRHQPGFTSSRTAFFPSCQLAASSPQSVRRVYEYLFEKLDGGVGLMLNCCGAPANWDGREDLFQATIRQVEGHWRSLGRPAIVTACPTCFNILRQNLPDASVETLYTVLERIGLPDNKTAAVSPQKLAIHDSCAKVSDLYQSVRNILGLLGHEIEELPLNRDQAVCCGYGELKIFTNRKAVCEALHRRIGESETDYVAYCAMCRDNLAGEGKRTYHLVDLIFGTEGDNSAQREVPGYAQRQENRGRLKTLLLREIWGESVTEAQPLVSLIIPDDVKGLMEGRGILADDVLKVITCAESSGQKFKDIKSGHFIAYHRPVSVTYWVEYSPQGGKFLVHNAYSHRLEISGQVGEDG